MYELNDVGSEVSIRATKSIVFFIIFSFVGYVFFSLQ